MTRREVADHLIEGGLRLFAAPREFWRFTGNKQADELLNNLDDYPHAYVLGCIADRQIPAEKAWIIPHEISLRLGSFSICALHSLSAGEFLKLFVTPSNLHRFNKEVSRALHDAVDRIVREYDGDASRMWANNPRCSDVESRFLAFRGVGPKIASMAVNGLVRHFKIPMTDYSGIPVSADVHVRRVFARTGLCSSPATIEECVGVANELYPEFPGLLDFPTWEIGRKWCYASCPACEECCLTSICEKRIEAPARRRDRVRTGRRFAH